MPRANRYILPGGAYHLTHRCHNRSWLLRFARDRTEYCRRLRECLRSFEVSLLTYCVTSNHTHLLVTAKDPDDISRLMQRIEGEFAGAYNARKHRTGAFWSGRYHCTMIESGKHLRACMRYIELNMVRAGAVKHPAEWRWCGFGELAGTRQRYRMLDLDAVLKMFGGRSRKEFAESYQAEIGKALATGSFLQRDPVWTDSIAVGSESFVLDVAERTRNRVDLDVALTAEGLWTVREQENAYE
jgi:putative transposase